MSLFILFLLLLGRQSLKKIPRLCRFKSDRGEIWQECFSRKYASTDSVGFLIWRHNFKIAAISSVRAAVLCCHLVSQNEASATRICSKARQFLICSTVWVKNTPLRFSDIFSQTVGNFLTIFTHLLDVPIYASLQIFIQLSLTVTKLCHIKCDHPANFYIILELLLNLFIEQITSLLTSCYIRHVCWHYKSVCS